MIKVIEHGRSRQSICYNCGCIFTFEKEDAKLDQTGINDYEYFVKCPDCKKRNKVSL